MKHLTRILHAYSELDALLEKGRNDAPSMAAMQIENRQVLNDQAYFVLCWGQLESEINLRCRDAIRRRRSDPDWQVRRSWDLYNPEDPRPSGLSLENRTALVLDRAGVKGSPYARAMTHLETRNKVAHGTWGSTRINVPGAVRDFYLIQAALHRAA